MGCDCHGHAEIKVGGVWHHYSHPRIPRNYALFGKLAGVRDESVEPISEPRGLPDGLSTTTRLDVRRWGSDGHSHSYLSGAELAEVVAWFDGFMKSEIGRWYSSEHEWLGYLFSNGWTNRPSEVPDVEDVRFVFWFDS